MLTQIKRKMSTDCLVLYNKFYNGLDMAYEKCNLLLM